MVVVPGDEPALKALEGVAVVPARVRPRRLVNRRHLQYIKKIHIYNLYIYTKFK